MSNKFHKQMSSLRDVLVRSLANDNTYGCESAAVTKKIILKNHPNVRSNFGESFN